MDALDQSRTHELFAAVGEQLAAAGARAELVVIGGSALLALGLISRATRDVDVVALLAGQTLIDPRPEADLRALSPMRAELLAAARWTQTHDPSEGFREQLLGALAYLGAEDVDLDA